MANRQNRREFLSGVLGGVAGLTILRSSRTAFGYAANERLNVAVFGDMYNSAFFLHPSPAHTVVAVCNPDQRKTGNILGNWRDEADSRAKSEDPRRRHSAEEYRRLAQRNGLGVYDDFRRMFDDMEDRIDALVVSHYDHFHGAACGAAMRLGKPVCSERPLGFTIADARSLRALAAETKVPTTYRSPGTGTGEFRRAMELVAEGLIGDVQEVHIWFKQGGVDRDRPPEGSQPVPDGLNWDLWLAPLAERAYHPEWMAYSHWRETCNGGLGVFGMHTTIFPFMALNMRELWNGSAGETTIRVSAECSRLNRISFPRWERVRWEVPARGGLSPATIHWHHGPEFAPGTRELIHGKLRTFGVSDEHEADDLMKTAGSMLVGSEGALVADDHSVRVTALPRERFEDVETKLPLRIPGSHGIYPDWMNACRGGDPHIIASFDNGGPLSEFVMLGNIATLFPEQTLTYDPVLGRITDNSEANEKLKYEYRDGWRI